MNKQGVRLKTHWEATWIEDFEIMRLIGHRAWTLCLFMRVSPPPRKYPPGYCYLPETTVKKELGWNPKTTRKCLKILIEHGYIIPQGYCLYKVRKWRRLSTDSVKNTESIHSESRYKLPTESVKNTEPSRYKLPTESVKSTDSLYNRDTEITEIQREKDSASPVENFNETARIDDSELPSLRSLYPFDRREDLKRHLMATRGFSEKQVSDTFERVYPLQYTGKAR